MKAKEFFKSITVFEYCLWGASVLAIILAFVLCESRDYLSLAAGIVGVCGLIFVAKGNVIGQVITVVFSVFYGMVSSFFCYYGEMITYLGMTAPAAIISIVTWLRNSFGGKKMQVSVNRLLKREYLFAVLLTGAVTTAFYFILRALNTANLLWSTVSVATSFLAMYLLIRRCPFYAIAYALNDVVLITLWSITLSESAEAVSMIVCFAAFLLNDIYGFVNWTLMRKKQTAQNEAAAE